MRFSTRATFQTNRTRDGILFCGSISFSDSLPFSESRTLLAIKSLLPTDLSSEQLSQLPREILERALFSARTASAEYLQEISDTLDEYFTGKINKSTARLRLEKKAGELGLEHLGTEGRINLIIGTNAATASGFGQYSQAQQTLFVRPGWELYRAFHRKVPRNWIERWTTVGGDITKGRLIAPKNDDIWQRLGDPAYFDDALGNPYPPFAFNSGMRVKSVSRQEMEKLGLIGEHDRIQPDTRGFNDDLSISPDIRSAGLKQALENEGYKFREGVLTL